MQIRPALLWDFAQCKNKFFLDCFTLEVGTKRLSLNIGTELPFCTAKNPRRVQISILMKFGVWMFKLKVGMSV
jgi:hypothetical protein